LQDAQRAMGLVRANAKEWGIHPKQLVSWIPAGAISLPRQQYYHERTYPKVDDADAVSCRPDFTLLIYPAYLTLKGRMPNLPPR